MPPPGPGATEAVAHARRLAAEDHTHHRPLLAAALRDLGRTLAASGGEDAAAFAALRESVQLYRSLAARSPERYRAGLAASLAELGGLLGRLAPAEGSGADDPADAAMAAFEEAARLLTAAGRPGALAEVLLRHAQLLGRLGRTGRAPAPAAEAVGILRGLVGDPGPPCPLDDDLAAALQTYGLLLSGDGRHDEAVAALEEAVRLRARRVRAEPAIARRPEVPVTYALYGIVLVAAERPADAVPPLAAALGVGTALDLPEVTALAGETLIRAHQAAPAAVRSRWRAATGENPPEWIGRGRVPAPAARPSAGLSADGRSAFLR